MPCANQQSKTDLRAVVESIPYSSNAPKIEQETLFAELNKAVQAHVDAPDAAEIISYAYTEHRYSSDARDILRTLLLTIESGMPLSFIKFVFLLLREHGVDHVHRVLNKDSILAAEAIHLASYEQKPYHSSPLELGALLTMPRPVRKMIHYALVSGDSDVVASIVRTHNPATLPLLKSLHYEQATIATPLHAGVL